MYIIIEKHGGPEYAVIVTDENGENLIFDSQEEAQKEAENCQDAIVLEIN